MREWLLENNSRQQTPKKKNDTKKAQKGEIDGVFSAFNKSHTVHMQALNFIIHRQKKFQWFDTNLFCKLQLFNPYFILVGAITYTK